MSWTDVDLTEIPTGLEVVPKGRYDFQLLPGAKYGDQSFNVGSVEATVAVASGDNTGRRLFLSYPNPASTDQKGNPKTWSLNAFKRLVEAVGTDIEKGEEPVAYLNRVAGLRVNLEVTHYESNDGGTRAKVNIFNPAPAKS